MCVYVSELLFPIFFHRKKGIYYYYYCIDRPINLSPCCVITIGRRQKPRPDPPLLEARSFRSMLSHHRIVDYRISLYRNALLMCDDDAVVSVTSASRLTCCCLAKQNHFWKTEFVCKVYFILMSSGARWWMNIHLESNAREREKEMITWLPTTN